MLKKLAITGIVLLLFLSLTCLSFAQETVSDKSKQDSARGAVSDKSKQAPAKGPTGAAAAPAVPAVSSDRLSYWTLAGLGKSVPAGLIEGPIYNPYSIFGPFGIHGQYSIYGPYGMYGSGGPGYGSGLGFNGFGMNDPWMLYKQYMDGKA